MGYWQQTWDAVTKQNFNLHAVALWTINDFPAYGDISGWSTKGYLVCPVCNKDTSSRRLRSKICYMDHRRFLPYDHIWRQSRKFDGKPEKREKPHQFSGSELLQQLEVLPDCKFEKHPNNKKRKRTSEELNWTRKPILFELNIGQN